MKLIQIMLFIAVFGIIVYAQGNTPAVPTVNVELPRYFNENLITIQGTTTPNSLVRLYVNDKTVPQRALAPSEVPDGSFVFENVALMNENEIIVWVQSPTNVVTEKVFHVSVDTNNPILDLEPIQSLVTNKTLVAKGRVNEPSIVEVFLARGAIDRIAPAKVTGLEVVQNSENSIEIGWNQSKEEDFSQYIVYRNGTAVATARPATYTTFTDVRVNANQSYTYQIATVDQSGNTGPLSEILTVTALPEGRTNRQPWPGIQQNIREQPPLETLNVSDNFNTTLRLDRDDSYVLKIRVTDRALNAIEVEKTILLDTTLPKIEDIEPRDGSFVYENYADQVDIKGLTKPNASVVLFVNKSIFEKETYSTKANSEGYFAFRKVDLSRAFSEGLEPTQISPSDLGAYYQGEFQRMARKATATIEVTDLQGRKASRELRYQIGNCWSGNLTWDATPLLQYQEPKLLSTERIAEGTETIYFYINFSYFGIGTDPKIEQVSVARACDDVVKNDPRYNISCRILTSGCTTQSNLDKSTWYISCPLRAFDEMNQWLKGDWNSFFKAVSHEMVFPFRLQIRYSHVVAGSRNTEIQTMCQPVTYVLDDTKIDFSGLPDFLLYDTVNFLNDTIHNVDAVQEKVEDVLRYTGVSCMASFAGKFGVQVYRRTACKVEDAIQFVNGLAQQAAPGQQTDPIDPECSKNREGKELKAQKELSNECLKKYFPGCSSAWDAEAKVYQYYRALCDRVFCHTAPSRWTEDESSTTILTTLEKANACGRDQPIQGLPLRAQRCGDMPVYESLKAFKSNINEDDLCFETRTPEGSKVISTIHVLLKNPIDSQGTVFEMVRLTDQGLTTERQPVIKINDNTYVTNRPQTCSQLCVRSDKSPLQEVVNKDGIPTILEEDTKEGSKTYGACLNTISGRALIGKDKIQIKDTIIEKPEIVPSGYTKDCFINPVEFKSEDTQKECFCIYKPGEKPEPYYTREDFDVQNYEEMPWSYRYWLEKWPGPVSNARQYDPDRYIKGRDQTACFGQNNFLYKENLVTIDPFKQHTSAFQCGCISGINSRLLLVKNLMSALQGCLIQVRETGSADSGACQEIFSQFVCSLAWRTITFVQDGCVAGQQTNSFEKSENKMAQYASAGLKGFSESINSLQGEFTQDYGNTQFSNLIGVGEETAVRKACLAAFGYDFGFDVQDALDVAYATPYATLVQAIEARREYLTYDPKRAQSKYEYRAGWIINPGCDMDDYDVELACITRNELDRYSGTDCTKQDDPKGVNCDCLNLDKERTLRLYDGRALKQSVLENKGSSDIRDRIIPSQYRYDHLKFTLIPDRGISRQGRGIPAELREQCFSEGHEDGVYYFPIRDVTSVDIKSCYVDQTTGAFNCPAGSLFFGERPSGQLVKYSLIWETPDGKQQEQPVNDVKRPVTGRIEIPEGASLSIKPEIWKAEGSEMCLHLSILNNQGQEEGSPEGRFMAVTVSGAPFAYQPIKLADSVSIGTTLGIFVSNNRELISSRDLGSRISQSVNVEFIDDDKNDVIRIDTDSLDRMRIGNVEKTLPQWGTTPNKLVLGSNDNETTQGLYTEITSVQLPLKPAEKRAEGDEREDRVTFIFEQRLATQPVQQEEKTIRLELIHLKQGTDRYTSAQDCNTADVVQFENVLQVTEPLKVYVIKK